MIRLLLFDLDGTLLDSMKEIHYESLNSSLEKIAGKKFVISRELHEKRFDGIPTSVKLNILTDEYGLLKTLHNKISDEKQRLTLEVIRKTIPYNERLVNTFKNLRKDKYITACFTNSLFETARVSLECAGIYTILDAVLGNDQVLYKKPSPQGYLTLMAKFGIGPRETIVYEDNHYGLRAGYLSGAHLCRVDSPNDLTEEFIRNTIGLYQ